MGIAEIFQETPDFITNMSSSISNAIPVLILVMILIGIIYWLRSVQRRGNTEIRVYKRP
jgi:hypothetical protein